MGFKMKKSWPILVSSFIFSNFQTSDFTLQTSTKFFLRAVSFAAKAVAALLQAA